MNVKLYVTILVALFNILLGIHILKKNYQSPNNIFYFLLCLSGGLWALTMAWFLVVRDPAIANKFIEPGIYIFGILAPMFYVLFTLYFPFKIINHSRRLLSFIVGLPLLLIILIVSGILDMENPTLINEKMYGLTNFDNFLIFAVYFVAYSIWGFIILINKLNKEYLLAYRTQIKYLLVATILTFCLAGTTSVILPLFSNSYYDWLGPIFTLANFLVIGYLLFIKPFKLVRE